MLYMKRTLFAAADAGYEGRLAALKRALQTAIELEHATIPPYLYALYSIKPGANQEVVALIRSIVMQEMLHMSLDCNILNAIGGKPRIDDPKFIPTYPGPLPGCVEDGLIVPLAPISKQLVHDVFMVIEEPEDIPDYPGKRSSPPPEDGMTIGEFYAEIKKQISALSAQGNIFTGDPNKQLTTGFKPLQTMAVTDERSALAAIDLIVEQGEGSSTSPLDPEHQLAHFYKYEEIYYGRKLIPNPDPRPDGPPWAFVGHQIAFDPSGVWPVISNPQRSAYPAGSRLCSLNDAFNANYSRLLQLLHQVFNGQPDWLAPAILSMQALQDQAQLMMASEVVPGQTAGPTFEYNPPLLQSRISEAVNKSTA